MPFIYEQTNWPGFRWDDTALPAPLAAARFRQGRLLGRMEALGFTLRTEATLETLTEDVVTSSAIEGERLDRQQVRSSIARRLGMDIAGFVPADRNVEGVVEMMLAAYYRVLEATQRGDLDITAWLTWFLACLDRAFDRAESLLVDVMAKGRFCNSHADTAFNPRQRAMVDRLLDGFEGRLTSSKWAKIMKCSQDTALREIDNLLTKGALVREAAGFRSTSYVRRGS